jgi:hypothetical protein
MAMREGKKRKKWGKGGCSIMYVLVGTRTAEARPETERHVFMSDRFIQSSSLSLFFVSLFFSYAASPSINN